MPPRHYENQPPGPEPRYRPGFSEEENIEEPKDKTPQQKPKPEEKKPEKKPEQDKKEVPKEDEKTKKPELSPEEKQERRSDAVERSLQLKKQFEESPIPNDPSTVARLIIAEHILSIDEQLQDPEALVGGRKKETLEASLDFMCDLSEKLEDPTVESPPHIQDAYEALLELTEEALGVVDTPHQLVEEIAEVLDLNLGSDETAALAPEHTLPSDSTHPPQQQPLQTLPALKASPAAKNLLIYLHLASLPPSTAAQPNFQPQSSYSDGGSVTNPDMPNVEHKSPLIATVEGRTQDTIFTRPKVHDAREYHLAAQPNIAKPLAVVALASIAASAIHRTPDISHRHESSATPSVTPNHSATYPLRAEKISHSAAPPSLLEKPAPHPPLASAWDTPKHETFTPTSREFQPHTPETISSGRKLEHMSLSSLLALAHDVHLGHGRYLKDEFEHGRIDKDGLVKVLKAKKKGLNFAHEFNTQTANFRQRLQSIEFITKPPKPIYPNENTDQVPTTAASADSQSEKPERSQKEAPIHPILERYAHPEESFFQPAGKNPIPISLIVTILAIIILGTLIFLLLLPI